MEQGSPFFLAADYKARYTPNSKPSETVNFNAMHYGYIAKHCTCNQVFETVTHVEIILWDNFCSSCPTDSSLTVTIFVHN